jgi:hypothetical protein
MGSFGQTGLKQKISCKRTFKLYVVEYLAEAYYMSTYGHCRGQEVMGQNMRAHSMLHILYCVILPGMRISKKFV